MVCLYWRSKALWLLGYSEAALADIDQVVKHGRESGHAIRRGVYPSRNDPHHAPTVDQPNSLLLNPNFLDRLLSSFLPAKTTPVRLTSVHLLFSAAIHAPTTRRQGNATA